MPLAQTQLGCDTVQISGRCSPTLSPKSVAVPGVVISPSSLRTDVSHSQVFPPDDRYLGIATTHFVSSTPDSWVVDIC